MESQIHLNDERKRLLDKFREALPDVMSAERYVLGEVYKEGALSIKVKRLIALAIALRVGCTNCILSQTMDALDAGATREEILETLSVEIAMSGTSGIAWSCRVIKLLEELGKI
jgi:AhpD family alkylhydroperoxidase